MGDPKYRLIYFKIKILGEPIRLLFHYAGVPFEDVRIDWERDGSDVMGSTEWGMLPILEIDGKQLSQSIAIGKYLAKKYNMDGANDWESAKCVEYVGVVHDLRAGWRPFFFEEDQTKKQAAKKKLVEIIIPRYFSRFNKLLEENGGKYLVGSTLTWADLFVVVFLELFQDTVDKDILKPYPLLQEYKNSIYAIPQIKKYIETRPATKV